MRSLRAALTRTVGLLLAVMAAAGPAAAEVEKETDLVRLVSPRPGATLVGGSALVLEWQPGPGLAALRHAEEWEVFLSLDGGRTFLSRITPHLDIRMRRVTVHVPRLPSNDVRLLLRMGDERDEREQLLPGRYRIVLDHAAIADVAVATVRCPARRRGPARPASSSGWRASVTARIGRSTNRSAPAWRGSPRSRPVAARCFSSARCPRRPPSSCVPRSSS